MAQLASKFLDSAYLRPRSKHLTRGHSRPGRLSTQERSMTIRDITHKIQDWRRQRAAVRELSQLSDRELHDLGISPADIGYVTRKAARGCRAVLNFPLAPPPSACVTPPPVPPPAGAFV